MMRRFLIGLAAAALVSTAAASVQEKDSAGDRFKGMKTDQRVLQVQPGSAEEAAAWNKVSAAIDPKRRASAAEAYLAAYPEGGFAPYAHEVLAVWARQNNDMKKFFDSGEKAVAGLPDAVALLSSLSWSYAEQQQPDPAIRHGEKALALLPTMERPAEYLPEVWPQRRDSMLADAHYGVGTALLFKAFNAGSDEKLMSSAIQHLNQSIDLRPADELTHFRLGFAYQISGKLEDAMREYARTAALGRVNAMAARQYLEQVCQKVQGNTKGVDKLIDQEKKYFDSLPKQK